MRNYSARIHLPLMSDTGAEMSVYNLVISVIKAKFDGKNCVRTEWLSKVFFSGKRVLFVRKIPN